MFETTTNQKQGGLCLSAFLSFSLGAVFVDLCLLCCVCSEQCSGFVGFVFAFLGFLGVFFCCCCFPWWPKLGTQRKELASYKDSGGLPAWVGSMGLCYLLRPY